MDLNEKQLDALEHCDQMSLEAYVNGRLILDEYGCFYTIDEYFFGDDWDDGPELSSDDED